MNSENLLLNAILTQNHVIPALKFIDETYFAIDINRQVYSFIKDYFIKYKKVPSEAIIRDNFKDFVILEEKGQLDFFIDELIEKKYERHLSKIISVSLDKMKTEKPSDVVNYLSKEVIILKTLARKEEDVDIVKTGKIRLNRYIKTLKSKAGKVTGIVSGIPSVDRLTDGFHPGELICLMGMPGMGKSWLCMFFAVTAWMNGFKPLFISLEMNHQQLANRFDALVSGLQHSKLKHYTLNVEEFEKYKDHLLSIREGRPQFIVSNPSRCTQSHIFAKINEYRPDICFIDYVSLVEDERGGRDSWDKVDHIMRDLKNMTRDKEINIPIVALAQVHRGFDRNSIDLPELENVAHSYAIAAHSDIVMALHQNHELHDQQKMKFGILKNRDEDIDREIILAWNLKDSTIKEENAEEEKVEMKPSEI